MSKTLVIVNGRTGFASGGTNSYIDHLANVADTLGMPTIVAKMHKSTEGKPRTTTTIRRGYMNMSLRNLRECWLEGGHPVVIPMLDNRKSSKTIQRFMDEVFLRYPNAHLVIQSPHHITDFTKRGYQLERMRGKIIVIGDTLHNLTRNIGCLIPQPYLCQDVWPKLRKSRVATCPALVSAYKHSDMVLEANRELPESLQIPLRGRTDRIYMYHHLMPKYPEVEKMFPGRAYKSHYGYKSGYEECLDFQLCVNLTTFREDGGRSEYLTMEAWDAGAVPVLHSDWLCHADHEMVAYDGYNDKTANCFAVSSASELAERVMNTYENMKEGTTKLYEKLIANGRKVLRTVHHPSVVAPQYQALFDNPARPDEVLKNMPRKKYKYLVEDDES